jgi:hypothetical protein
MEREVFRMKRAMVKYWLGATKLIEKFGGKLIVLY